MHDIRFIRENPERFLAALRRRGNFSIDLITKLDSEVRGYLAEIENLKAELNKRSREFGEYKRKGTEPPAALAESIAWHKDRLAYIEASPNQNPSILKKQLDDILNSLPNLPADDVPQGADEDDNAEVKRWGEPRVIEGAREHFDIGAPLGLDFESAQAVSGARFAYLRGQIARLNRAIGQFMLDTHTEKFGYQEVVPPVLVRDEAVYGTAQLPKFKEDLFQTYRAYTPLDEIGVQLEALSLLKNVDVSEAVEDRIHLHLDKIEQQLDQTKGLVQRIPKRTERLWLIPTAEVSLTNLVREQILDAELPLRFTALTLCFRSEAGAAGKDTRGLIRQHQFEKVELVSITTPDQSEAEHERMTGAAEHILEALELPYRRMLLCSGDMGFSATRTFDLEVWLPGQGKYREISSCSNCGDFQARRLNTRYRPAGEKGTRFVHTLNGSGLAVGRTLVAILENYQQADGSVIVPTVLRPYMGGRDILTPQ